MIMSLILLAVTGFADDVPVVQAKAQTEAVASTGDAADDAAVWVHPTDASKSLILGTDKKKGVYVYDLGGNVVQFVPSGRVNNIDIRQNIALGDWQGDLAVASNRSSESVSLYSFDGDKLIETGSFPSQAPEPYGICMGMVDSRVMVFVTHKTGALLAYEMISGTSATLAQSIKFNSQLEGCVFDEASQQLFIGEENLGIWKSQYAAGRFEQPVLVDRIGAESGLAADVEGLSVYRRGGEGYLVASSQGNNSFALYTLADLTFVGRFAVQFGADDRVQETDGLDVSSASLGSDYPHGILVVQDGVRPKGATQNFKIIDWRDVKLAFEP